MEQFNKEDDVVKTDSEPTDEEISVANTTVANILKDKINRENNPEFIAEIKSEIEKLERSLKEIGDREELIIRYRYGLNEGKQQLTLKDIAEKIGVSTERVRQLEERALLRLNRKVFGYKHRDIKDVIMLLKQAELYKYN